jgi:hypothetical protein
MSGAAAPAFESIPNTAPPPPVLKSLHDTGLGVDQIEQLLIKTLYGGESTGLALAERIRLPFTMLEPLLEHARSEQTAAASTSTSASTSARRRCRSPPTSRRCGRSPRRASTSTASACARAFRT